MPYDHMGETAHDPISGFYGVITGYCEYLGKLPTVMIEGAYKDGTHEHWFAESRVVITPPMAGPIGFAREAS
jgi:hypothetical protein